MQFTQLSTFEFAKKKKKIGTRETNSVTRHNLKLKKWILNLIFNRVWT